MTSYESHNRIINRHCHVTHPLHPNPDMLCCEVLLIEVPPKWDTADRRLAARLCTTWHAALGVEKWSSFPSGGAYHLFNGVNAPMSVDLVTVSAGGEVENVLALTETDGEGVSEVGTPASAQAQNEGQIRDRRVPLAKRFSTVWRLKQASRDGTVKRPSPRDGPRIEVGKAPISSRTEQADGTPKSQHFITRLLKSHVRSVPRLTEATCRVSIYALSSLQSNLCPGQTVTRKATERCRSIYKIPTRPTTSSSWLIRTQIPPTLS